MSEPPATTRSSSPLRMRSAPMPTAVLELAHAEETVITRPRAPLMRLMIEVQCETSVAATVLGRIRSHRLPRMFRATSSVRTRPLWELPRHTPIRSGSRSQRFTPEWRIASRYASTVRSVARSIHDRASASTSTGTSSPKLLASSLVNPHASKWVTFAIESRPSSSACPISAQLRPSGENAPIPTMTALRCPEAVSRMVCIPRRAAGFGARAAESLLEIAEESVDAERLPDGHGSNLPVIAGILHRPAGPRRCSTTRRRTPGTTPPRRPPRGFPSAVTRSRRPRAGTCGVPAHRPSRCG